MITHAHFRRRTSADESLAEAEALTTKHAAQLPLYGIPPAEPADLGGARDISAFKGWRAFMAEAATG